MQKDMLKIGAAFGIGTLMIYFVKLISVSFDRLSFSVSMAKRAHDSPFLDIETLHTWHFGTTYYIVCRPKKE
jgi:hypothetical protein